MIVRNTYISALLAFLLIANNNAYGDSSNQSLNGGGRGKFCMQACAYAAAFAFVQCHARACVQCPFGLRFCSFASSYAYAFASAVACVYACDDDEDIDSSVECKSNPTPAATQTSTAIATITNTPATSATVTPIATATDTPTTTATLTPTPNITATITPIITATPIVTASVLGR